VRADAAGVGRVHDGAHPLLYLFGQVSAIAGTVPHAFTAFCLMLRVFMTDFKPHDEALMFRQVRTVDQGRGGPYDIAPGSTPLHAAAFRGDVGIVQAVIQVQRPQYRSVSGLFCSKSPDFIWYYGIMATLSP